MDNVITGKWMTANLDNYRETGEKKNEILVSADIIDKRKTTNEMQLKAYWKINNKQDKR